MNKLIAILISTQILSSCAPAIVLTAGTVGVTTATKDKTVGRGLDETVLAAKVKKAFLTKGFKNLYVKIHVNVQDSKVYLNGKLDSEDDIVNAIKIAWEQEGVKEVISELKIDENSNVFDLKQYTIDASITASVKAKLLFTKEVKSVNYTVVTFDNVVHIFGIARTEDEREIVTDIVANISGVDEVVSHIKILEKDKK